MRSRSSFECGSSSYSCARDRSAELTSKYGFSVVAPISVITPSSTAGSTRVLLRLVESVDLVEEEDRALSVRAEPLARARDHLAHLRDGRRHRRELLECRAGRVGDDAGQRRLAAAGRPVEDHRSDAVLLDREPERGSRAEHVLLADEVVDRLRPQSRRERRDLRHALARGIGEEVAHGGKYAPSGQRDRGRGLLRADPSGDGGQRLRALSAHGRAARAAEVAGRALAPRRAPLHDRAPVVGALAEARVVRGRDRGRAAPRR